MLSKKELVTQTNKKNLEAESVNQIIENFSTKINETVTLPDPYKAPGLIHFSIFCRRNLPASRKNSSKFTPGKQLKIIVG